MRKMTILTLLLWSSLLIVSSCSQVDGKNNEDKIILKIADSLPTTNYLSSEGTVFFMKRVKELTDGQVEFEHYPAEQIGKASSYLDLTLSKTIDIGYTSYSTERLPLTEVVTLPGAYNTAQEGSEVFWKLMQEYLTEEEYMKHNVRPIFAVALPQYQYVTANKPIRSLDDINGTKARVTGTMEFGFDLLGASPVFMPASEAYTALERGTVDGVTFPYTSFEAYQIETITNYTTKDANFGSFVVVYAINEEIYESLPESIKKAIKKAGDETVEHLSKFLDDKNEELAQKYKTEMEVYELTEEESAEWDKAFEPAWDRWAEDLENRGFNAYETIKRYRDIQEELGYAQ
ncbi:TRAP transporter substrate-binding protein DctP [Oceanobacillus polygoni]|uniref:TRAP-type C4-dicarboxylate transport system substrate-binding protein n=1 Tax=Oceanobacillus polygoni TaxID=1235259 RepID=A0A9X0YN51_9BACI|nr:TRAP transporter substrate-binding protein DctP [Oceanobacillus polygoni]MBP2075855.1 TRAP-type C4-dicarboxylate transport system substrate-binding protein [Oceanobacillus polygoni]